MTKSSRNPKAAAAMKKKKCEYFFLMECAYYYIFSSPIIIFNGGIHGNSPSGIVCSGIGINNSTDVASLLTVVLMAIPPMAVEEAALWTASNYQARVIRANVINRINCTFDQNQ
jgi:hypothetical protein